MSGGGSCLPLTSGGRAEVAEADGGGGEKEREGRAWPSGVEGVGPGAAFGTRPGARTQILGGQRLRAETGREGSR